MPVTTRAQAARQAAEAAPAAEAATRTPLQTAEAVFELAASCLFPRRMLYHYYRRWLDLRERDWGDDTDSPTRELWNQLDPLFRGITTWGDVGAGPLLVMQGMLHPDEPLPAHMQEAAALRQSYRQGRWGLNVYQEYYDWLFGVDPFTCPASETHHQLFSE